MKLKAKKSLGQNFLKDEAVLQRIVESAELSKEDVVIEIGTGTGLLTEKLAGKCKKVIAIELDDRLVSVLQEKFKDTNVEIIHGDILNINLPELIENQQLQDAGYKVVANIPYYITAPIIRLMLETKYPPKEMILMVQKEVAERIVAKPGEMSILAVSVQYYAQAQFLFTVFKESFDPKPKVDSAVVRIAPYCSSPSGRGCPVIGTGEGGDVSKEETKKFFRIVKSGFSAKRKTLVNNLSNGLQLDKSIVEEKLESLGFPRSTRAQELGVEDWKKLVELL